MVIDDLLSLTVSAKKHRRHDYTNNKKDVTLVVGRIRDMQTIKDYSFGYAIHNTIY